ncbi:hypothetical protein [Krasilnikovia sp. MM14-A1259]|uniref:hypothetical protein n=1 Tax=Krasilnikovia sp. MM14-A1259 TaxID=3373539 RepID=UPI00382E5227
MAGRREILESLRDQLIAACPASELKELPALSRELRQVLAELDAIPDGKAKAPADEIAKRRADRRRKAAAG